MGTHPQTITDSVRTFIAAQRMFFVATAPRSDDGHINLSPKGLDCFRILGPSSVGYLDYTGSGIETVAHLRENGRLTIMFCAFEGKPNILRLQGEGRVIEPHDAEFESTLAAFGPPPQPPSQPPPSPPPPPSALADRNLMPVRSIIVMNVKRVADSCGFGVPLYDYRGQRDQMVNWSQRKGPDGVREYQRNKNAKSLDGLPGLRSVTI